MSTDFFFNYCFEKKRLKAFILWSYSYYGRSPTVDIIEKMKEAGFRFATQAGISIGLDDLQRPPQKARFVTQAEQQVRGAERKCRQGHVTGVERSQQLVDTWHRTSERLREDVVDHFRATDILNPVYMMAFSGARGNISQVRQLTAMRGLMADPEGRIVGFPIRSSFREGLTVTEYMISCYGARKGLVDTAIRTADAGYLTRRLVDVAHHVTVTRKTCGTRQGIYLKEIRSGKRTVLPLEDRLIGRVLAADISLPGEGLVERRNQPISTRLAVQLASHHEQVLVRSPLKCSLLGGVCQFCYGWDLTRRMLVDVGEAVGVMAAQSIGEPGTQLTMRTFHTGGVYSGHLEDDLRAPHAGVVHFPRPLQGLLIRTSHGRIAFLIKVDGECIVKQMSRTVPSRSVVDSSDEPAQPGKGMNQQSGPLGGTQFLLEASTILLVRQGDPVEEGDLLAQFPSTETEEENDDMVEEKRIIFAQLAGQVAFTQSKSRCIGTSRGIEAEYSVEASSSLQTLWILAGSRIPLSDPWWTLSLTGTKISLFNQERRMGPMDHPLALPSSMATPGSSRRGRRGRRGTSQLSKGSTQRSTGSAGSLSHGREGQRRLLPGEVVPGGRPAGKEGPIQISAVTIYSLHREGGHLLDGHSLLVELFNGRGSTAASLHREYANPSAIRRERPSHLPWQGQGGQQGQRSAGNEAGRIHPSIPSWSVAGELIRMPMDGERQGAGADGVDANLPSSLGAMVTGDDQVRLSTGHRRPLVSVGQYLQAGQPVAFNLGTPVGGQVIGVGRNEVTLRRTETILAYAKGRLHVNQGDWINGSTPIVELPYRQLLLDDIVQGIPKIEQLFEASKKKHGHTLKKGIQAQLNHRFNEYKDSLPLGKAVQRSVEEIQQMLVEAISKVYLSQGVLIADKHFEIIIRQMTSKVKIITPGQSGFLRDEHVHLQLVRRIHRSLPPSAERAYYEPALVGITGTALNAEGFLSAASFQETTRVLSRHAFNGRLEYLRGLKQHVIVGDLIPAGTGINPFHGPIIAPLMPLSLSVRQRLSSSVGHPPEQREEESPGVDSDGNPDGSTDL